MIKNNSWLFQYKIFGLTGGNRAIRRFQALHRVTEWGLMEVMSWRRATSTVSGPGRYLRLLGRGAACAAGFASLATGAAAHPVTYHMAFISEADDGLTRQSVDALSRAEPVTHFVPPSEYAVASSGQDDSTPPRRHALRHRWHHRQATPASDEPSAGAEHQPAQKRHPWVMRQLITFTNWWNGWSEKTLRTKVLDVHLDRPARTDKQA